VSLALFDLDNTLLDRVEAFARWAAAFAARHDLPPGATDWLVEADGDGYVPRSEFLTSVRERFGLGESVDDLLADYDVTYPTCARRTPGVLEGLAALRTAGWRVGIVTNGRPANQTTKMERLGLLDAVDAICVSEAVGVAKPDPKIFALAAERAGANLADGGWMVGDSPALDVGGGAGAGLSTIWISRGRAWPGDLPAPDRTCADVVGAIASLRVPAGSAVRALRR
jgi:putative hydrolase of the HAD superfamily